MSEFLSYFSTHIPILQVIIPIFAALIATISFRYFLAYFIACLASLASLIISIYQYQLLVTPISYMLGGWLAPIGIEYRLDLLNQPLIIYLNFILCFFLIFGRKLIQKTISPYLAQKQSYLFFPLLLFAHAGYVGVVSTNDLFNLYVFIEISSLATYVLIAQGKSPKTLLGAFDYLIIGTIGASFILIAVGFLLAICGSLNISDITKFLQQRETNYTVILSIAFFLCGAILKMAFFPLHFWLVRAYNQTSACMLTYIGTISNLIGIYLIIRFLDFTVNSVLVKPLLTQLLQPISLITIISCSFLALANNNLKKIIIYSGAAQIGYVFLLLTNWSAIHLLIPFLFLDSLNKITLFTIIAHLEQTNNPLRIDKFRPIQQSNYFKLLTILSLIFSASLPISASFFIKLQLLSLLVAQSLYLEFAILIFSSFLALLYHWKIAKTICLTPHERSPIIISKDLTGLTSLVILQLLSLIFLPNLTKLAQTINLILT